LADKKYEITISIIIPTYNYADLLPRAVTSVVQQLEEQHELLIIDDGSTDNTANVIEQLKSDSKSKLRSFYKKNGGAASARNVGIKESRGEYLIFLDADDELAPLALQHLEQHIINNPNTRMVIGGHIAINSDGRKREYLPTQLPNSSYERVKGYLITKKIPLSNGACAMHRSIFERGTYPEHFRSVEDIPVFAQVLAHYPCTILQQPIVIIHKHDDSLRHQLNYAKEIGLDLVEEVFSSTRLGQEYLPLKKDFYVQRCLSLFRSAYIARDNEMAKKYFKKALRSNWRILFKGSYLRKAFRVWTKGKHV
jgi:glycosyltransferase involved in cell wall biosynthesis